MFLNNRLGRRAHSLVLRLLALDSDQHDLQVLLLALLQHVPDPDWHRNRILSNGQSSWQKFCLDVWVCFVASWYVGCLLLGGVCRLHVGTADLVHVNDDCIHFVDYSNHRR